MKNLSKVLNEKDIATKEYVDPVILSYGQQYTETELDELMTSHRTVLINQGITYFHVSRIEKISPIYTFYCYSTNTHGYEYLYNYETNNWLYEMNYIVKSQKKVDISIWTGTQTEYDAITTKDANTLYFVIE